MLLVRNKTTEFKAIRDDLIRRRERINYGTTPPTHVLNRRLLETNTSESSPGPPVLPGNKKPNWLERKEQAHVMIESLSEAVSILQRLHKKAQTQMFDVRKETESQVLEQTNRVAGLIARVESITRLIVEDTEDREVITDAEQRMRINAARVITMELVQQSRLYRQSQNEYYRAKKEQLWSNEPQSEGDTNQYGALTGEFQQQQLAGIPEATTGLSRAEIQGIVQRMEEVHQVFQETNRLTVVQGSLFDRIDHNLGEGLAHALQAKKTIHQIEHRQRHGFAKQLSMALAVLNAVMFVVNLFKFWPRR